MKTTALASLNDELNGAYLYDVLSKVEKDPRLAEVYRRMSVVEGPACLRVGGALEN